jgi:Zn-dependent protease/predicted transcriptional regulator
MRNKPLSFKFFKIDVFIPTSGWLGLLLIAYFALPTSMAILSETNTTPTVILLALSHSIAIYLTIFIHELGHVVAAKKRDYEVKGIFLHLFGGHTSFLGKYRNPSDQFWTALSGPLATLLVSVVAFVLKSYSTGVMLSLSNWLLWSSLAITLVNLLPGVPLDGGGILSSVVWRTTKSQEKGQLYAGYGGYFVAGLWFFSPFLYQYFLGWVVTEIDIFFSAMIGVWLFTSARMTVKMSKIESVVAPVVEMFHELKLKDVARRCIIVDENVSLRDALENMHEQQAGSILVSSNNAVIGIVHEKFVEMQDGVDTEKFVSNFAMRTSSDQWINFNENIAHNEKIDPTFLHGQWVAIDDEGKIFGVLHRSDISARMKANG